ncbi:Copia protein [Porphyridium purpureum]|uniref:Copia protein n=1 Tax=Porphyridium purpureum TaxID=35688 RepID=A0A5J4YXY0_PORPP|nr:Copia protein [Porphyridium purpureum]|eukprot:POR5616..scf208_2
MKRTLRYINATQDLTLTLGSNEQNKVYLFVDAAFGVHDDMKSHSGCIVSLRRGAVYCESSRQALASKSSTEAELVAVSDCLGQAVWVQRFLESIIGKVGETVLLQDNEATIKMIRNGKPNSARTRHMSLRHFFGSDRVACGELTLMHCPTEAMHAGVQRMHLTAVQHGDAGLANVGMVWTCVTATLDVAHGDRGRIQGRRRWSGGISDRGGCESLPPEGVV